MKVIIATIQRRKMSESKSELCEKVGHEMEQCFLISENLSSLLTVKMKEVIEGNKISGRLRVQVKNQKSNWLEP